MKSDRCESRQEHMPQKSPKQLNERGEVPREMSGCYEKRPTKELARERAGNTFTSKCSEI